MPTNNNAISSVVARLTKLAEFWKGGDEWLARELSGDALRAIGSDIETIIAALPDDAVDKEAINAD